MTIKSQIKIAIGDFPRAVRFIFDNNLSWYFVFPALLTIGIFIAGYFTAENLSAFLQAKLTAMVDVQPTDSWFYRFIGGTLAFILSFVLKLLFFFALSYFGGYIVLIAMSPVLAFVSEHTEKVLTGTEYSFNFKQFVNDIWRGIYIALRNLFIEIGWIILLFIIGFLPIVGQLIVFLSPIILFIISAYFYGFSFIDYSNERRQLGTKHSINFVRENKGLAIGNGFMFAVALFIPSLGIFFVGIFSVFSILLGSLIILLSTFIISTIAVIATVAATISVNRIYKMY